MSALDPTTLTEDLHLSAGEELILYLETGGHWYGHGFNHDMPFPLETGEVVNDTFAVNNIQCPAWMCSAGVVLYADTVAPLRISLNTNGDGQLRICCDTEDVPLRVFRGETLPEAHAAWLRHLGWPNTAPAPALFGDSLFCTWTQYPRCITQDRILDMARKIRTSGIPCTILLIDDRWERGFGELAFSETDFPDPAGMFAELKRMDFAVWLWVTPFVNDDTSAFAALAAEKVLVPREDGTGAATFRWWGGTAGLVDVTAPAGRDWYRSKLEALLALGADGFKIDGGDFKYQPAAADCAWGTAPGASGYSDQLLSLFEELVPNRCESRTAWCSQRRNMLWREGGKDSHWGEDNGLKALVHLGLHLGLLGYDLLIPDMVPGRVQTMNADDPLPTDELMVRWTEASALFPCLQFSYFPWNYAEATARAVTGYARLHKALEPYLASQAEPRSKPLFRPLWYDAPEIRALYAVPDAFLLGDDLLAAPVLSEGTTVRDIPLPPGDWRDAWTGETVSGLLRDWPAPCPGLPLFVRDGNPDLLNTLQAALSQIDRGTVTTGQTTATWQAGLNRDLSVTG